MEGKPKKWAMCAALRASVNTQTEKEDNDSGGKQHYSKLHAFHILWMKERRWRRRRRSEVNTLQLSFYRAPNTVLNKSSSLCLIQSWLHQLPSETFRLNFCRVTSYQHKIYSAKLPTLKDKETWSITFDKKRRSHETEKLRFMERSAEKWLSH